MPTEDELDPIDDVSEEVEDAAPDVKAEIGKANELGRKAVVETFGSQAPAAEVTGSIVEVVHQALMMSMDALTDGEMPLPDTTIPKTDLERVPPETFAAMDAFAGMINNCIRRGIAAAKPYEFDADTAAKSDDGLLDAAEKIALAGKDKTLKQALLKGPPKSKDAAPVAEKKPESPADRTARIMMSRRAK